MQKLLMLLLTTLLVFVTAISGIACDCEDETGNGTADTTAPIISDITISGITDTKVTISWATDESATSNIEYSPDTSYGYSFPSPSDTSADETRHSLTLSGLSHDTTYHFQVKSTDASGNEAISGDQTFTTTTVSLPADNTPPVISNVTDSDVTDTGAIIIWTTDEAATSQIEYGATAGYSLSTTFDANLVNTHSVNLTGLTANTTYHYRVKSKDAAGNESMSADYSFSSLIVIDMGKIVFSSTRDGNQEIYIMNADGTSQTRLTNNSAVDANPKLSADGQKIVFDSDRDGNQEIYVMNVDGTDQTRITNNTLKDSHPSWSPDGTQIVFDSGSADPYDIEHLPQIWIMNADGSDPVQLTSELTIIGGTLQTAQDPVFSADGTRIAFTGYGNPFVRGIWTMNADGTNEVQFARLSQMAHAGVEADWSPDSTLIAFTHYALNTSFICISNGIVVDTSGHDCITAAPPAYSDLYNSSPSYSPDGSKIAFYSNRDGNNEIYIMNADGSSQIRLTNNPADDSFPSWGPTA